MKQFTCKNCIHAGEPHLFGDSEVVECRSQPVTVSGFPIVSVAAWCTPGKKATLAEVPLCSNDQINENTEPAEGDSPNDYITSNNGDGSVTTLHVPTTIMNLYNQVKYLNTEVEMLKRNF